MTRDDLLGLIKDFRIKYTVRPTHVALTRSEIEEIKPFYIPTETTGHKMILFGLQVEEVGDGFCGERLCSYIRPGQ